MNSRRRVRGEIRTREFLMDARSEIGRRPFLAGALSSVAGFWSVRCARRSSVLSIASVEEFRRAVLRAKPGSILEVADGEYAFDDAPLQISLIGSAEQPVVVRAANRGKARLTGKSAFACTMTLT